MKDRWQSTAVVVLLALIFGFLLGRSTLPRAEAQTSEGTAGRVTAVLGSPMGAQTAYSPIVVIDGLQQSLMLYEYSYRGRSIELKAARSFRYDKEIKELNNKGLSVDDVRKKLNQ